MPYLNIATNHCRSGFKGGLPKGTMTKWRQIKNATEFEFPKFNSFKWFFFFFGKTIIILYAYHTTNPGPATDKDHVISFV